MAGERKSVGDIFGGIKDAVGGLFAGRRWLLYVLIGVVALFVLLAIVFAVAGRRRGGSAQASNVNPGMLTAGIVVGNDRYSAYDESGKLAGIEPDLAAALAEAEGLDLKLVEIGSTAEALNYLDTGVIDVAFGRFSSDLNLNGYTTSAEYSRCGLFLVSRLHDYTDSLALMTGYSIGVMNTVTSTAERIDNYQFITPKDYADPSKMGQDIRDRTINLGICNERDALAIVRNYPSALQTQEIAGGPAERYVAVFPAKQGAHATVLNAVISSGQ